MIRTLEIRYNDDSLKSYDIRAKHTEALNDSLMFVDGNDGILTNHLRTTPIPLIYIYIYTYT
jgi:hypothetical protein